MGARKAAPKRGGGKPKSLPKARAPSGDKFKTPPGSDIRGSDIGVTEPLGIFDPGNFMTNTASYAPFPWAPPQPQFKPDDTKYRRWQEMEIKHGRIAMLATVHVLVTTLGVKWPFFDLSVGQTGLSETGKAIAFADVPGGTWASWAAIPAFGWAQIVGLVFALDVLVFGQDPEKEAGDVVPDFLPWVRYDDTAPYEAPLGGLWPFPGTYTFPSEKAYKLNVERNNGRAAMLGIFGMMFHEALTGNPVWPIPADVEGGVFAALGI
jgi:light-harvesting complex I chlorophyll a/b binding protein 1